MLELNTEHQIALRAMQNRFRHDLEVDLKLDVCNPERIKQMTEEFKLLLERQNESLDLQFAFELLKTFAICFRNPLYEAVVLALDGVQLRFSAKLAKNEAIS